MKNFVFALALLILISGLWGCEKKGNPPVIPPEKTMLIDFSDFIKSTKSGFPTETPKNLQAVPNLNWSIAATVAGVWNTLLTVNLAVPVAAFKEALTKKPSYLDNKKWQWKYNVNVLSATYIARLTGQITSSGVKWEMYITREGAGGFSEFLWFEGTSASDGKSGQWILTESQTNQVPMLQIDWTITGTEVGSVKYTYIKKENPMKNSYIEYGLTSGTLNAFYKVYLYDQSLNDFVTVDIEWSTTGHNGRIKAQRYFGDTNWHCWDGNGNDIQCP